MKSIHLKKKILFAALLLAISNFGVAQKPSRKVAAVEEKNVRAHMEFLAGDALQGRGSGTQFELLAGQYIASQMRQFGVEPAGDGQTYIQTVNITRQTFAANPKLNYTANGASVTLE